MQENAKTLSTGMPDNLKHLYNRTSNQKTVEYFPYIKFGQEGELLLKKPGEEQVIDLGKSVKARVLAVFQTYAFYDKDMGRNTVTSTKYIQGDPTYVVDSNFNEAILCRTRDDIKKVKDIYYGRGQRLKFSKVAYVELVDGEHAGTVVEMYIKLSHNYVCSKDKKGVVSMDFNNPLENSFDTFMNYANNRYPFNIVEISTANYKLYPTIIQRPMFVALREDEQLNFELVNDVVNRVGELNQAMLYGMTIKEEISEPGSIDRSKYEQEGDGTFAGLEKSKPQEVTVVDAVEEIFPDTKEEKSIGDTIKQKKKIDDDDLPF